MLWHTLLGRVQASQSLIGQKLKSRQDLLHQIQAAYDMTCSPKKCAGLQSLVRQELESRKGLLYRMQAVCYKTCYSGRARLCEGHRFGGMQLPPSGTFLSESHDRFDGDGDTALPVTIRVALELEGLSVPP